MIAAIGSPARSTPFLALLLLAARATQEPPANGESFALFRGLHASARLHFSAPSGPCEQAARRLAGRVRGQFEVSVDPEPRPGDAVRVLVGAPTDPELLPCARACGVEPLVGGFRVLGRDYTRPGDALQAVIEDPLHAGRPVYFVIGNDLELLGVYLDGMPRLTRPHLWVHADGELALECPLAPDGRAREAEMRDYLARREEYFGDRSNEAGRLIVHMRGTLGRERWKAYALALTHVQRRVCGWFGYDNPPAAELFLYEHLEDFERCVGAGALAVTNRLRPRVHVLLAPGMPDDGGAGLARIVARYFGGAAAEEWLEDGLGVAAAGSWWRRPLDEWLAHLAAGKLLPAVNDVFAPDAAGRFSEHVLLPARALLFRESAKGADAGRVRALWKGARGEPEQVSALYERALRALTEEPAADTAPDGAQRPDDGARRPRQGPFRHGLALVESGRASYGSRAVEGAVAQACAVDPGPDALSLTVFATTEDPLPSPCPPRPRPVHGSASDLALASGTAAARSARLAVLLSLEVLARPTGAWADVISWTGADDQTIFWTRYGRIAEHYALLSELLGLELFSFGSNLRESARTEGPGGERSPELFAERRAGWAGLIPRLRAAYGGGLAFSSRSPAEAEETGFLEELDYIGLFLYARGFRGVPDETELQRVLRFELQQAVDLGVKWNRPVLLVQVGFPARADSWTRAMVPRGAPDPLAQRRYFSALAAVLEAKLENDGTLGGFFLWNWPVAEADPLEPGAGFSLRGSEVEPALRRLFVR
jgi:hypothetical protein